MKKLFALITLAAAFLTTACNGYNGIMYRNLSDEECYETFQAEFVEVYYYDYDNWPDRITDYTDEDFWSHDIFVNVILHDDELYKFTGRSPDDGLESERNYRFEINAANNRIVAGNGFYNDIVLNETIEVRVSRYIYMDADFYYIAELKYNGKEYLDFNMGLRNIIRMMDDNRSFF